MQIRLLGTGSAEGWPGMFCGCAVCRRTRQVGGKNFRTRTSALIDDVLKIDLPPDTLHHVVTQNLDMTQVELLLFTHGHDDHCAASELQYLSPYFVPEPITTPLRILAPRTTLDKIEARIETDALPLDLGCLSAWETITTGRWRITSFLAHHDPSQTCLNYLLSDGVRTLLYATDTGWYDAPTWDFLTGRRIDGAVIEVSKGKEEGGYTGHLSIPEVIRMRERLIERHSLRPDGKVVTTHHSHLSGLMHEEFEALLNPHGIEVGYDGMVFTI